MTGRSPHLAWAHAPAACLALLLLLLCTRGHASESLATKTLVSNSLSSATTATARVVSAAASTARAATSWTNSTSNSAAATPLAPAGARAAAEGVAFQQQLPQEPQQQEQLALERRQAQLYPAPEDARVRLAGGADNSSGRVEVFYNRSWGTVCNHPFGQANVDVVCRQLGFEGGALAYAIFINQPVRRLSYFYDDYFYNDGEIWLSEVACAGTETKLTDCAHAGWGEHDCTHYDDVWVECENLTTRTLSVTSLTSATATTTAQGPTTANPTWPNSTARATATRTSTTEALDGDTAAIAGTISLTASRATAAQVEAAARAALAQVYGAAQEQIAVEPQTEGPGNAATSTTQTLTTDARAPSTSATVTGSATATKTASARTTANVTASANESATTTQTRRSTTGTETTTTPLTLTTTTETSTDPLDERRLQADAAASSTAMLLRYEVRLEASRASERLAAFNATQAAEIFEVELAQYKAQASDVVFSRPTIVGEFSTTTAAEPLPNSMDPDDLLGHVKGDEAELIDFLRSGSASRAEKKIGGGTITAQRVDVQEVPANGSVLVAVSGTNAEVAVPASVFEQLGLQDAIVIITCFDAAASAALGHDGAASTPSVQVISAINLNIASATTGEYMRVRDLQDPIGMQLPAKRSVPGVRCAYWDALGSMWNKEGFVDGEQPSDDWLVCYTTHLTLFGAIVEGFVSSLECSQAALFSADAMKELGRGDWYRQAPAIVLWLTLAFLLTLMAVACHLDRQRARSELWDDLHFLIPEDKTPSSQQLASPQQLAAQSNMGQAPGAAEAVEGPPHSGLAQACCLAWACVTCPLQCFAWWWGFDAVKDAIDDLMENFIEYFGDIRTVLEGFVAAVGCEAPEGGRVLAALSSSMSAIMVRNAQLQTGAELGIAHDDVMFVMDDKAVQAMLAADATYVEAAVSEESSSCEQKSNKRRKRTADSHVLRVHTEGDRQATRARKLTQLRQAVGKQVNHHLPRHSFWSSLPGISSVLFIMHNPVGNVLVPSIFTTSAMRVLLLTCKVTGALLIASLFFDAAGDARSKFSDAECGESEGVGQHIGRLLAVGVASALVAGLPVSILSCLHSRKFKRFPREGCPEWKRQLSAWRVQDGAIWVLGTLYIAFGIFFICLFLANVERDSLSDWIVSACVSFVQDGLVVPVILAVFGPLFAMVALAVVSCWRRSDRGQVIEEYVATPWRLAGLNSNGSTKSGHMLEDDLEASVNQTLEQRAEHGESECDLEAAVNHKPEQHPDEAGKIFDSSCGVVAGGLGLPHSSASDRVPDARESDQELADVCPRAGSDRHPDASSETPTASLEALEDTEVGSHVGSDSQEAMVQRVPSFKHANPASFACLGGKPAERRHKRPG